MVETNWRKDGEMDVLSDPMLRKVVLPIGLAIVVVVFLLLRGVFTLIFRGPQNLGIAEDVDVNSNESLFPGESIGSISTRLGEDVRDVWGMGFSDDQINGVLTGKYSLEDLYRMEPEGNTKTPTGEIILARRRQ